MNEEKESRRMKTRIQVKHSVVAPCASSCKATHRLGEECWRYGWRRKCTHHAHEHRLSQDCFAVFGQLFASCACAVTAMLQRLVDVHVFLHWNVGRENGVSVVSSLINRT